MNSLIDAALAVAYPQVCAVCDGSVESRFDGVACAGCWREARLLGAEDTLCWKCGVLLPGSPAPVTREEIFCHRCDEAAFTASRACGLYQGALRAAIIELKRAPHAPRRVVDLMVETCSRAPLNHASVIVPVPLHPQREKDRGFNQALVLARALAQRIGLPVIDNCLLRVARTERHRAGMDAKARHDSVRDAFAVQTPAAIVGAGVLLLDDVFTTGATVSACAEVLRMAGASEVLALTLARPVTE